MNVSVVWFEMDSIPRCSEKNLIIRLSFGFVTD